MQNFISDVLNEIDDYQLKHFDINKELFLTRKDKVELLDKVSQVEVRLTDKISSINKSVYIVGLVQFLAIIALMLAIINFMLK
jgi:BMFP domain-containing protein YqiC